MQAHLHKFSLFAGLEASCLEGIISRGKKQSFVCGEALFHEGQQASGIHILVHGFVKVVRTTTQGRELVLFLARPGNLVGEGAVFQMAVEGAYSSPYVIPTEVATALATEAVQTLFLSHEAVFQCLEEHPPLALRMLKALATRQRMFMHKLAAQAERGAVRRVAAYICHRCSIEGGQERIELGVSREDLANLLGLARETVSRQLSLLLDKGVIDVQGRVIVVKDIHVLKKMAQEG